MCVSYQASAVSRVPPLSRAKGLLQVRGAGASHEEAARALLLQALLKASQGTFARIQLTLVKMNALRKCV